MRKITLPLAAIGGIAILAVGVIISRSHIQLKIKNTPEELAARPSEYAALGDTTILLEIARTENQKERGLGGQTFIADQTSMFFWNNADGYPAIWMKDMRFSIDILWLARDGRIVDIKPNATPDSYPEVFVPKVLARYVIEVRAGFSRDHHVNIGDSVALPRDVY